MGSIVGLALDLGDVLIPIIHHFKAELAEITVVIHVVEFISLQGVYLSGDALELQEEVLARPVLESPVIGVNLGLE